MDVYMGALIYFIFNLGLYIYSIRMCVCFFGRRYSKGTAAENWLWAVGFGFLEVARPT